MRAPLVRRSYSWLERRKPLLWSIVAALVLTFVTVHFGPIGY